MIHNKIAQLFFCLVSFFTLVSCEKEPVYDKLEGHWKLEQFTLNKNKQVILCDRIYWGITYMVTEVAKKVSYYNDTCYLARTEYRDNYTKLVLKEFKHKERVNDMIVDATEEELKPFGINNPVETEFQIVNLSENKLILKSNYAILQLTRF